MNTDVLFINPGNHQRVYQDLSKRIYSSIHTCLDLIVGKLYSWKKYTTVIYDVNVEGWDENTAKEVITKYNPLLIVMMVYGHQPSASTQTMPAAGRIATDIKKKMQIFPLLWAEHILRRCQNELFWKKNWLCNSGWRGIHYRRLD